MRNEIDVQQRRELVFRLRVRRTRGLNWCKPIIIGAIVCVFVKSWSCGAHGFEAQEDFQPITSLKVPGYVKVVDYTGRGPVSLSTTGALIPELTKPIVIVLADELILRDENFDICSAQAPRQVVLIADTIRVDGLAQFNLGLRLGSPPVGSTVPPCFSPYLPQPNSVEPPLGFRLPAVVSIITPNLLVGSNGGICMFCGSGGDPGGHWGPIPQVESAIDYSLTIAAERVDLAAKATMYIDAIAENWAEAPSAEKNQPFPTSELKEMALAFLGSSPDDNSPQSLQNAEWVKPFLIELQARPPNAIFREADIDFLRRFWKKGFEEAPDSAISSALTAQVFKHIDSSGHSRIDFNFGLGLSEEFTYVTRRLSDSGQKDPQAIRGVSLWTVHTYQKIYADIMEAERTDKRLEILRLLQTFTSLPSYPVHPDHKKAYQRALNAVKEVRDRYRKELWRRSIQINLPGLPPRPLDIFSEGGAIETYVAPTQALLTERVIGDRTVLGTVRYVGATARDIELRFTAELHVDPLVAEAAKAQLNPSERYAGQFSNWELTARPIAYDGIKSADSSVTINGNTLDVKLRLDGRTGTLALWQLTSDSGIPITLDFEYRNDPKQKGKLLTIPLSLARRKRSAVTVMANGLNNTGRVPVTVSYVQLADGSVKPLLPQLVIGPGEARLVPGVAVDQMTAISVPASAVSVNVPDPYSLNEFQNADQADLTEKIVVRNTVPVTRVGRPGNLQFLELHVIYKSADGQEQETKVTLAPFAITGSEAELMFIRFAQGEREVWISGTAVYDNGRDKISPKKFTESTVIIDGDTLSN